MKNDLCLYFIFILLSCIVISNLFYYTEYFIPNNVDIPIINPIHCKNKCMPPAQCSQTRTQCVSDLECMCN
jgi:hypothetical protein